MRHGRGGEPDTCEQLGTGTATQGPAPKYLAKGRAVAVTGRLVYREWEADDGTRRSRHHIIGRVQFGGRPDSDQQTTTAEQNSDDDIDF
ncbi:MAG: single-stranded DNA-binding protein [Actinomycetota bacterium]|nr:single-stranded DNA-binding protein [Actinomycetota bacterium]